MGFKIELNSLLDGMTPVGPSASLRLNTSYKGLSLALENKTIKTYVPDSAPTLHPRRSGPLLPPQN